MSVYCISCTIKSKNYESLFQAIKSYGVYWRESETVWFIESTHTTKEVLDNLRTFIEANDKLLVIQVHRNWWAVGYTEEEYTWIKARNF